ncbi:hypothetical protein [Pseudomonas promysalinigenes]
MTPEEFEAAKAKVLSR